MSEDYHTQVRVPKDRIAVVIGARGETKQEIKEKTGCNLSVNTEEGIVTIHGKDPLKIYTVQQIVKAIARGFSPQRAMMLLKSDFVLDVIELRLLVKKEHMQRVKGRIIGEDGKSRETIEALTECLISVYGKTVSIIGRPEGLSLAKRAVLNLIQGSPHSNVYHWLERKRGELSAKDIIPMEFVKEEYKNDGAEQ